jgi:hypothetical protein
MIYLKILGEAMVVFTCNPSTQEAETGELTAQSQPELHRETLSQ